MKILFNCFVPFSLTHGGGQIQIEQTRIGLEKIGVQVEPLRWWDENQTGDVLHHFGRMPSPLMAQARQNGVKVVLAELLTGQGSRSKGRLKFEGFVARAIDKATNGAFGRRFGWECYRHADASVALTPWEASMMQWLFGAPSERVHVIPNGVEDAFFESPKADRGPWLICTATITQRKRVLELAEASAIAKTPLWVIGKPYSESDPYMRRFLEVARANPQTIRYEGAISDRAQLARIYREARGFVLLSTMESLSLSALEAAACECPLLLSDLPWARTTFSREVSYCSIVAPAQTAPILKEFYDAAPNLKAPPRPPTWVDVARQLKALYDSLVTKRA